MLAPAPARRYLCTESEYNLTDNATGEPLPCEGYSGYTADLVGDALTAGVVLCCVGLVEALLALLMVSEQTETVGDANRECLGQVRNVCVSPSRISFAVCFFVCLFCCCCCCCVCWCFLWYVFPLGGGRKEGSCSRIRESVVSERSLRARRNLLQRVGEWAGERVSERVSE